MCDRLPEGLVTLVAKVSRTVATRPRIDPTLVSPFEFGGPFAVGQSRAEPRASRKKGRVQFMTGGIVGWQEEDRGSRPLPRGHRPRVAAPRRRREKKTKNSLAMAAVDLGHGPAVACRFCRNASPEASTATPATLGATCETRPSTTCPTCVRLYEGSPRWTSGRPEDGRRAPRLNEANDTGKTTSPF